MSDGELGMAHPLSIWNSSVLSDRSGDNVLSIQELTNICSSEIEEIYQNLIAQLDVKQFKGKLAAFKELWI